MSQRTKFYVALAGVFVTLLVIVGGGMWLYVSRVQGIYTELRNHQAQLDQNEQLQALLINTRNTVQKREKDLALIRTMLYRPGEVDLEAHIAYVKMVEQLATTTASTPVTLTRTQVASPEQGMSTKFTTTTTGTFESIIKFLAMLEELPIHTVVEQASISGSGENMTLTVTIAVATAQ